MKIYEIINNKIQTNVLIKNDVFLEKTPKIEKKVVKIEKNSTFFEKNADFSIYENLMKIRLNNILSCATKENLQKYSEKLKKLDSEIINLDQLRIINIINDFDIKAASKNGIVLTTSSENLLHDIYEEILDVDKILSESLDIEIKICVLLLDDWNELRKIYVDKIKNKKKKEILEENNIIKNIKKNIKKEKSSEFDDLLEIGGE